MRLRHKKPINSYKGQVNHDSSELYDEDFEKHPSLSKRIKPPKPCDLSEHVKKSAQILVEFVNSMNEDYRMHLKNFGRSKPAERRSGREGREDQNQNNQTLTIENNTGGKQLKPIKQQYNYSQSFNTFPRKTKQNPSNNVKPKLTPKQSPLPQPTHQPSFPANNLKKTEIPPNAQQSRINSKPTQEKPNPPPLPQQNRKNSEKLQTEKPTVTPAESKPPKQNIPQSLPSIPLGNYFQLDSSSLSLQQAQYLQLQMQLFNMMKSNQGINLSQYQQIPMLFQGNMANSNYMIPMTFVSQNAMPQNFQNNFQTKQQKNPQPTQQPTQQTNAQVKAASQIQQNDDSLEKNKKPFQKRQQKIPQKEPFQEKKKEGTEKVEVPPNFNKCASYHVAIAYNIHYVQLKNKGMVLDPRTAQKEQIQAIDPTYNAKKVRERKNTDTAPINLGN